MSKNLYLLDAYALIYRSYYAFIKNPRYNSKGLNTSAIYGFVTTLIDLIAKENPTHIAVIFDPPYPTFRHELYKEYKAQREATPEDIKLSIPIIKEIIKGFNIPVIEVAGYEADDTIGTLAKLAEKEGFTTYMMTPDKDYGQLVSDNIFMLKPARGGNDAEIIDKEKICAKYRIKDPVQVIDILGLMGDASDNIPGAPGIGEKTAMKLIEEYESIENLYEHIDEIVGKQKEKLADNKEQVLLSKLLATIKLDVPVTIEPEKLILEAPDETKLTKLFEELEFKTIAQRLFQKEITPTPTANVMQGSLFGDVEIEKAPSGLKDISNIDHDYQLIDSPEKRKTLIRLLSEQKEFCFDTETTGLDPHTSEIVGLSFSHKSHTAFYIPFPQSRDDSKVIFSEFKILFECKSIRKIGQNIKFDISILKQYDIEVFGEIFDTMIAHYLMQPDLRHNLNYLSEQYLRYKPISIEELIGKKGIHQDSMRNVSAEKIKDYACEDADLTFQLKEIFEKELQKNNLDNLSSSLEMPLIPVLADMEQTGINVDRNYTTC